jgi:hypothetical protein
MNVDELIIKTFKKAKNMASENNMPNKDVSKIIYPCYRQNGGKTEIRISEQEIKQLFIQTLIEDNNFYFSVETPTRNRYSAFSSGKPQVHCNEEDGRSACFDLCLYDSSFIRKHLIEFKAKNPDEKDIKKDFLKLLAEEENLCNYFIHILDLAANATLNSICTKYNNSLRYCINECKKKNIATQNTIAVYTFIINNQTKTNSSGYYKMVLNSKSSNNIPLGDFTKI